MSTMGLRFSTGSARPRVVLSFCALAAFVAGCSQRTVTVQLRPLQQSGDVSYVCRAATAFIDADGTAVAEGEGLPLKDCSPVSMSLGERDLHALVTQTATGEVAVINIPLDPQNPQHGEGTIDLDPYSPGFGFAHVGAQPTSIVSTPGGQASFVAVAEAGNPGIFALPTSCLSAPDQGRPPLDLTTWAACSLPAAPGSMVVVVSPLLVDGEGCNRPPENVSNTSQRQCFANLGDPREQKEVPGRQKLIVALPDRGSIAVIDAQELLDRPGGEFRPCELEEELPLSVQLPAVPAAQEIPEDLLGCGSTPPPTPPAPGAFSPTPSDFSVADDTLYVSDSTAPVIHRVAIGQPCSLTEMSALYPQSFDNPGRVVTTSRVAVSPLTPSGKRFAYAIDQYDFPTASVMAFDVSPGASNRTPIVRPGSPYLPFEAPDRIQFAGSAKDLTFISRDRPQLDPATGNVPEGVACDPDPNHSDSVGALYRSSSDYTTGARPVELRGIFANILLTNGQIDVIDVEDFDAPCRRPITTNSSSLEDYRGCRNDPLGIDVYLTSNSLRTVTDEASCNMVEPHRARAASIGVTSAARGTHAPTLRGFPQLLIPRVDSPGSFNDRPKLLGVDFAGEGGQPVPARVYVGTSEYLHGAEDVTQNLEFDPNKAPRYSLVLPFNEPRAYPPNETMLLSFEGQITPSLTGGFLQQAPEQGSGRLVLQDATIGYCDAGVNDLELMEQYGKEHFGLNGEALSSFAQTHSDYVAIIADFPDSDDSYWRQIAPACSRASCTAFFAEPDAKEFSKNREFRIIDAQQQRLSLIARNESSGDPAEVARMATCCFPSGSSYLVRASQHWVLRGAASGMWHKVIATPEKDASGNEIFNCTFDCNARKRFFEPRVFEIAAKDCDPKSGCLVGEAETGDVCVVDGMRGVTLDEPAAGCIHNDATSRFAIYRGTQPSRTDMSFTWQLVGGFSPLRMSLTNASTVVSPQTLVGVPEFNWLTVVDAASLGLTLVDLDTLAPLTPTLQ